MIRDILDQVIQEAKDNKNQEVMSSIFKPLTYKIKIAYTIILLLLIILIINVLYSNTLLREIIKKVNPELKTPSVPVQ